MSLLLAENKESIKAAITAAELLTAGEIRVCIEQNCPGEVLDRAAYYFEKLGMHQTEARTGVLIYLAMKSHKFAIIGDVGINQVVADGFWESTKDLMLAHFKEGRLKEGLLTGIEEAGKVLAVSFPKPAGNQNELPNDIHIGDA